MSWLDILLAGAIIAGALYLLYRSLWKKKGYCPGCPVEGCPDKKSPRE
jgi:hypothetical protein